MFGRQDAPEQRFVREALLSLGSERPGLRDAARAVRSWDRVLAIAGAGSVAESIWSGVSLRALQAEVPEPARTTLREAHEGATARNALLLSEAAAVQAAFQAAGIESLILKGPGLLVAHYPDIGARHVGDIDILVRPGDVARAEEVARATTGMEPLKLVLFDGVAQEVGVGQGGHATTYLTKSGTALEIHGHALDGATDGPQFEDLFARSRIVTWKGRSLRIPSASDVGAMACVHVFDGHHGATHFLARHLADLSVLVGTEGAAWDGMARCIAAGEGSAPLRLSRHLLEVGAPASAEARWRSIVGRYGEIVGHLSIGNAESRSILRMLFPARAFMASRYEVPETSPLLPLLYLWRPIRGAWGILTGR